MDLVRMPSECSGSPPCSYIPILDPSQLPLQQLNSLALSEYDSAQGLHFCQQFIQQVILKGDSRDGSQIKGDSREGSQIRTLNNLLVQSICLFLSTNLSLRPVSISICLSRGYSWLWHLFFCLLGGGGRCRRRGCCIAC